LEKTGSDKSESDKSDAEKSNKKQKKNIETPMEKELINMAKENYEKSKTKLNSN